MRPRPRPWPPPSDAVTVHLAYAPETKRLVGKKFLDAMKPGAILINTSRGLIVDTAALWEAIVEKGLRVGLDVFENEPADGDGEADFADRELAALVTCTPHVGAATDQVAEAVAAEAARIVEGYLRTGHPAGTVNLCARSPGQVSPGVSGHLNRVGMLALVLDGLREEGVNVEEMENTIFAGAKAGCCSMLLDQSPSAELLASLGRNENILHMMLNSVRVGVNREGNDDLADCRGLAGDAGCRWGGGKPAGLSEQFLPRA